MKRIYLLPSLLLLSLWGCNDLYDDAEQDAAPVRPRTRAIGTTHYYWYGGRQEGLNIDPARSVLVYEAAQKDHILSNVPAVGGSPAAADPVYLPANLQPLEGAAASAEMLMTVVEHPTVAAFSAAPAAADNLYQSPCYLTPAGEPVAVSNLFHVKLNAPEDLPTLQGIAFNTRTTILGNDRWMPLWYVLACDGRSMGNALEMANYFYETGEFAAAEPDFLCRVVPLGATALDDNIPPAPPAAPAPNDPFFKDQWNLHNTGQAPGSIAGVDINYLKAKYVSQGDPDVTVAVIDNGFHKPHGDINYADHSAYAPRIVQGKGDPEHGTACAGIIASFTDNGIGLAGIAPSCPLLAVTALNSFYDDKQFLSQVTDAIISVTNQGASVISCSWLVSPVEVQRLDDAITKALTEGRNGKGCVVVFAAGNANIGTVSYPARSHPDIVVVGSIKSDGTLADSQWGKELDLVAPGQDIPIAGKVASDSKKASGTSFACPQVAAVAALVLSVKPELTQKEVGEILVRSARKLPAYTYVEMNSWINGSRHHQTGHGLLDAHAAVHLALTDTLPDNTLSEIAYVKDRIVWGNHIHTQRVAVHNGGTLTLVPTNSTIMHPGLYVQMGSRLKVVRMKHP